MFHRKLHCFRSNVLSYKTLLLSGKKYIVESTIEYLFFKSKSLKQHALKTVLQKPFRKKEIMLSLFILCFYFFLSTTQCNLMCASVIIPCS